MHMHKVHIYSFIILLRKSRLLDTAQNFNCWYYLFLESVSVSSDKGQIYPINQRHKAARDFQYNIKRDNSSAYRKSGMQ